MYFRCPIDEFDVDCEQDWSFDGPVVLAKEHRSDLLWSAWRIPLPRFGGDQAGKGSDAGLEQDVERSNGTDRARCADTFFMDEAKKNSAFRDRPC